VYAVETPELLYSAGQAFERCAYFDAVEALDCYLPLTLLSVENAEAGA
jgi:hypothetical protein